jgi:sec-independent protein translocase protein TatA
MFEGIFQPTHLLLVFAIVMLVFGPGKLPQLGKGLGEAIRSFREGVRAAGDRALPSTEDDQAKEHLRPS